MKRSKGFGSPSHSNITPENVPMETLIDWCRKGEKGSIKHQMKYTNYFRNKWNEYSEMEGSSMIHERDYVPMDCCLCGKHMPSIHDTHNPYPFTPKTTPKQALDNNLPHRCCSECDVKVINKRIEINPPKSGNTVNLMFTDFFNDEIYKQGKGSKLIPCLNPKFNKEEN